MDLTDLEKLIMSEGRELMRKLLEEHLELRGHGDIGSSVEGSDEIVRKNKRDTTKKITTTFGKVDNNRVSYANDGVESLFPKDSQLNLPDNSYSHSLTKELALAVANNSFDESIKIVERMTGVKIPKRQAEDLANNAAKDFDGFYLLPCSAELLDLVSKKDLLILTMDQKGIVMRTESLKEDTREKAKRSNRKMEKRLSKGEKKNCKRMSTVASVYSIDRFKRSPDDIMKGLSRKDDETKEKRPSIAVKRVWASLEKEPDRITKEMFDEIVRRDPLREKDLVCLVDGEPRQIKRIEQEAKKRGLKVTIVIDIIHVIEYLWSSARVFHEESSYACESWVNQQLFEVLNGNATKVAATIRRNASRRGLKETARAPADTSADYLSKKKKYLQYNKYLSKGFPIATGVIEGACRHLIKDRMDITGARWGLTTAEAILKLRSLKSSNDFEEYWKFQYEEVKTSHNLF
ncbi:MAG: ISKra4 family transposase [Oligoflexia bacterium]|nr:ISKra4 family transposase [Oligoflexia bacterium]